MPWTDDRLAMLRELNDKGSNTWIALQINRQTGSQFSRNAIIGKRHRLGLPCPGKPGLYGEQVERKRPKAYRRNRFLMPAPPEPMMIETIPPPDFLGIPLVDLRDDQCHYIPGNDRLYCGQPVKRGSSYCAYCHSIVWQRPKEKKSATFFVPRAIKLPAM